MNNYCTNCGKKLNNKELVCENCNTPVVDIPRTYKQKSNKNIKKIIIIILSFIAFIILLYLINMVLKNNKIKKLQKTYVEPYIQEHYGDIDYSVEFISNGQCIISGECEHDPVMGCDGGLCEEYEYLDEKECESYYYSIETDTNEFIITVVNNNNINYAIEGKNIYGIEE